MSGGVRDLEALGVLAEPRRARLYAELRSADRPLTRHQLAESLGMGRTLVAFHLEKLERAGLVQPAPVPTSGPGRPPSGWEVTGRELSATLPPRRYDVLAEVLVRAAGDQGRGEDLSSAARRAARAVGRGLGETAASGTGGLDSLLEELGFDPRHEDGAVVLANCPFDRLRQVDTALVCSLNEALAAGYLEGLGSPAYAPRLRPCPQSCCVVLEPTA